MSKVIMSEEQFERLLAAIRSYPHVCMPHVCMPCTRPHLYQWTPSYWYYTATTGGARTVTYDSTTANLKEG